MSARATLGLLLLQALLSFGCAGVRTVRGVSEVVPEGTTGFALDVVPTPREARLLDVVHRVGTVSVAGEREGEAATSLLAQLFPDRVPSGGADTRVVVSAPPDTGVPESFTLSVTRGKRGLNVHIAGADAAGRHWAVLALRQITTRHAGERWVRLGEILDRPGFPLRGSKRPLTWEGRFRANLSYDGAGKGAGGRDFFVPVLSPGGRLDATETGVDAAEKFFREHHSRGVRRFAIEFDDVPFDLTKETRDRFGVYPAAVAHYLRECRQRLRRLDPDALLYWLPQTYWTNHRLLDRFAKDVGLYGGLPDDLGLVLTGPEIVSAEIPAAEIARARRRFGLTKTKALIYDNRGREGDHGPLRGRSGELAGEADAVFGERGEPINRITRLDYAWNPGAYEPDRSLLLACREIVGPASAPSLRRLILEQGSRTALQRLHLFREVCRRLEPPGRAPVSAARNLAGIWRHLKRPIVDTGSQSP